MGVNLNFIPWHQAKALFWVGEYQVPLVGGQYTWNIQNLQSFQPSFNLENNALYVISSVSFSCDVSVLDYQAAVNVLPSLQLHQGGEGFAPLLRQRIALPTFLDQQEFVQPFISKHRPNELKWSLTGSVTQTAALIGKAELNAAVMIVAYEITDDKFVAEFKQNGGLGMPGGQNFKRGL